MAIKLDELVSWKRVPRGDVLKLTSDLTDPRRVRVHLNCEDQTWLYGGHSALDGDVPQFLAMVGPGVETLEFYVSGDIEISFAGPNDESQIWVSSSELEPNVFPNPKAVSFTEIVQRRARNPELEYMHALARQNQERMDATLAEQRAILAELKQQKAANVTQATTPSPATEPSVKTESDPATVPPGSS